MSASSSVSSDQRTLPSGVTARSFFASLAAKMVPSSATLGVAYERSPRGRVHFTAPSARAIAVSEPPSEVA